MDIKAVLARLSYKRALFLSIILTSLGVVLMNTSGTPSLGVVFIAVGGFFLIVGMNKKREEEQT